MSTYITLEQIQIQNANCVAGLTYGFPAVTHFLGYVHALSRKLQKTYQLSLGGCAIVCHQHQTHKYQPKGWGDYVFAQTKNPSSYKHQKNSLGGSPPIIEEGKMHLTVSLVIECNGNVGGEAEVTSLKEHLAQLCYRQKLAGGVINKIDHILIESAPTSDEQYKLTRKIRRRLIPGFMLLDRSELLTKHFQSLQENDCKTEMLDAWLDFSSLRYRAEPKLKKDEILSEKTDAQWHRIPKPAQGYLVPLMTGYKAISEVFEPGKVRNARDPEVPFCFVEAAYGVGEWVSPHRLEHLQQALWHYKQDDAWYLCKNEHNFSLVDVEPEEDNFDFI